MSAPITAALCAIVLLFAALVPAPLTAQERSSDLALAQSMSDAGDWRNAVAAYEMAMLRRVDDIAMLHDLSFALLQLERYDRARSVLDRIVELAPGDLTAQYNLGMLHAVRDRPFAAITCFERVLEIDSTVADAWYCLGLVYLDVDRVSRAREVCDRLQALSENAAVQLLQAIEERERARHDPAGEW